jgi:outer membrane lipoprotein SlyB
VASFLKENNVMEASTTPRRNLHPLITMAAISVTVFSAAGVAALTGVLPTTHSSTRAQEPAALVAPPPATQAAAPAEIAPVMPAAPAATPAPKPKAKPKQVLAQAPREPVVYRDHEEPVRVAQAPVAAPQAPVVQAPPAPVAQAGILGRVESVREIEQQGQHTGLGPIAGGVAGAVLGHQFGNGWGNKILTVAGAAGGAIAGREIEKRARATKSWEINVRLDDGTVKSFPSSTSPYWNAGDRVRLVDGRLQPA